MQGNKPIDVAGALNQIFAQQPSPVQNNTSAMPPEMKIALDTIAHNQELRDALKAHILNAVKAHPKLSKAICEQIAATFKHQDPNVKSAFDTAFTPFALGAAKVFENPGLQELQVMMNGKLIPVYYKLDNGNLVINYFTGKGNNKQERLSLTLVPNYLNSEFFNAAYKNPQPAAQRFQPLQPEVYKGPGQHQVNYSPVAPGQWQPPQPQHYQPMHQVHPNQIPAYRYQPQVHQNQVPVHQNVPAPNYEGMSLGLEGVAGFNKFGSQFFEIDKQFIQLEQMCNSLNNDHMPGQKEALKLQINQTLSWLKQALEITPDRQRKALVGMVEDFVKDQ